MLHTIRGDARVLGAGIAVEVDRHGAGLAGRRKQAERLAGIGRELRRGVGVGVGKAEAHYGECELRFIAKRMQRGAREGEQRVW